MMEKQPPKQIYLQAYDGDSYDDNTWCQDKITDDDIEYILQSEYDQLKSENEKLREALKKIYRLYVQEEYHLTALKMAKAAQQALNEVMK